VIGRFRPSFRLFSEPAWILLINSVINIITDIIVMFITNSVINITRKN